MEVYTNDLSANEITEPVTTDISSNVVTEPVTTDISSNVVTEPVTNDLSSNLVTKPVTNDLSANEITEPVATDISSNVVTEPVTTDISSNVVTKPVTNDLSANEITEPVATDISSNVVTEHVTTNKLNSSYIIYGVLSNEIVTGLVKSYSNISDKIVSTYKAYDSHLYSTLYENGFKVVLNDLEIYTDPTNAEITQNRSGIEKAIELGYTHTIHMNSELEVNDAVLLKNTLTPLIENKMSSIAWFVDTTKYILNYVLSGPVADLSKFYGTDKPLNDPRFIQTFTQEIYFDKTNLTFEDTKDHFNYSIQILKDSNIKITWIRYPENGEVIDSFYNIKSNYKNLDIKY
jgi:hypothetical protein